MDGQSLQIRLLKEALSSADSSFCFPLKSQPLPASESASSSSTSALPPKLGDFSRLRLASIHSPDIKSASPFCSPARSSASTSATATTTTSTFSRSTQVHSPVLSRTASTATPRSDGEISLGNFSKIFHALGHHEDPTENSAKSITTEAIYYTEGYTGDTRPSDGAVEDDFEYYGSLGHKHALSQTYHCGPFYPPPGWMQNPSSRSDATAESVISGSYSETNASLSSSFSSLSLSPPSTAATDPFKPHALYRARDGTIKPLYKKCKTDIEATTSTLRNLIPELFNDGSVTSACPHSTSRGVYLFVDTSNIEISFRQALAARYGLSKDTHFIQPPKLCIETLSQTLVRERRVRSMFAGCSRHPRHPEPIIIQELRRAGFSVDVSLRVPKLLPSSCSSRSNSSKSRGSEPHIPFVEHLVDETIQARMVEAIVSHRPGIMVLATGDGKPAEFSEGFFRHVEVALQAGWTVELVSWTASCSSMYRKSGFQKKWGCKFRVVELDPYLDELWAVDD